MNAEILSIGTELLLGDILNTNSQFLSKELAKIGISVYYHTSVGDNPDRLLNALKVAFDRSDIVITTGGLGPTEDDLTKQIISKYFIRELILHEDSLKNIQNICKAHNIALTKNLEKQAYILRGATVLKNTNGSAPGCIIEENDKILIMLPGPPNEATNMYKNEVLPYLSTKSKYMYISKTVHISGIGESAAESLVKDIIDKQTNPTIAPYAKMAEVVFRITAKAKSNEEANKLINPIVEIMYDRFGHNIIGQDGITLEECIVKLLKDKGLTLSCAESCTGGMVTSKLVNFPGASAVLVEGVVAYSNTSKINRLGVKLETLEEYGAVSKQVAAQMAEGIAKASNSDIGISTTGIAGPNSNDTLKPVGLVYVGIYFNNTTIVKEFNFLGDREKIRTLTTLRLLDTLRRELLKW